MRRVQRVALMVLVLEVALIAAILIGATSEVSIAAKPEPPFTFASFAGIAPTTLHLFCPTLPDAPSGGGPFPFNVTFEVDASANTASVYFKVKVGLGFLEFYAHAPSVPLTKSGAAHFQGSGDTQGVHIAGWNMESISFTVHGTVVVDVNTGMFSLVGTAGSIDNLWREVDGVPQEIKGCSLTLSISGGPVILE